MAEKKRVVAVIDCETDPFKRNRFPKPFLWGFYDGDLFRTFRTIAELMEFLRTSIKRYIIYAHNGGKFDYHFMLDYIPDGCEPKIIHGRLAQFEIGAHMFRDSYNIIPVPLSAYKKDEVDYKIFESEEREKPENWKKITDYLRGDCVYLFDLVMSFREQYGNGMTLAGSALKQWRSIEDKEPPRSDAKFYEIMAPYYFGGRVECFSKGEIKKEFNIYDINSAYPYAMLSDHIFSTDIIRSRPSARMERVRLSSLYHVKAISDGAFPFRKKDGGLYFPKKNEGIKEYYITGWEYQAAKDTKTANVIDILERMDFRRTANHKEYVNHFYNMRMVQKEILGPLEELKKKRALTDEEQIGYDTAFRNDLLAKLHLNGCYGKFGSRPDAYREYMIIGPMWRDKMEEHFPEYKFSGEWPDNKGRALIAKPLEEKAKIYYNVALAASITGYVRSFLWRHICKVRAAGGQVLYCDTDSMSVIGDPETMKQVLDVGKQLGQWKHEATCDYGAICGKKLYAFRIKNPSAKQIKDGKHWKTATKGVRLEPQEICRIAQGEVITYRPEAPTPSIKGIKPKKVSIRRVHRSRKKEAAKVQRIRQGSFVFSHRQVKMT